MKQKRFPCCKKPMNFDDVMELASEDTIGVTCKCATCPHCGKGLIVFLNIDSVEVEK